MMHMFKVIRLRGWLIVLELKKVEDSLLKEVTEGQTVNYINCKEISTKMGIYFQ